MFTFYEFFAGGGMARLGLGSNWRCLYANDFDPKKAAAYRANFDGAPELKVADVASIATRDIPAQADLVWASFPCQDLSLAGPGAGLGGDRSGAFWPFWRLIRGFIRERRKPNLIALENVCGALTSHGGRDFAAIGKAFSDAGYKFGAMVVDAVEFVPQSRPRLFIVGVAADVELPQELTSTKAIARVHPKSLVTAQNALPEATCKDWLWWTLPAPPRRSTTFADILEENPADAPWASLDETRNLLALMSPTNLAKVQAAQLGGRRIVGGIYRRTRIDDSGTKVQRAEIRFDGVAGCLRTPAGGSSRQRILIVEGNRIKTRLISSRETARLMGMPPGYRLPERYNDAYHLTGDGVVVPVVRWLAQRLFEPIILHQRTISACIAAE
jgi:DNA (cytosine-5)-methyltransferase 1